MSSSDDSDGSDGGAVSTTTSPAVSSAATGSAEEPVANFKSFGLDERLSKAIVSRLAFNNPTMIQSKFIPLALQVRILSNWPRTTPSRKHTVFILF